MSRLPARQVPAVHHRRFGDWLISTVSDGYVDSPPGAMPGLTQDEVDALMIAAQGTAPIRTSVNMFALRGHGKTYLFDAGSGTTMGPSCGRLPETLEVAGIAPEDVDAIFLTHVHPDHSNGLTSDEGEALFPKAIVIAHEQEISHWFDDAAMAVATERSKTRYFAAARFRLKPYLDRVRTFADGEEILLGITGILCPGHTPGHASYRISSGQGGPDLLIWGDTVHIPEIQVPRPEITMLYDSEPPMAAASRNMIFELVLRDSLLVAGMHVHFPGFARMARVDGQYRLLPEPWNYEI
jgi:glyoxylase-like metal-dependent hydrolase (beta-lactamase superfamily II)